MKNLKKNNTLKIKDLINFSQTMISNSQSKEIKGGIIVVDDECV